MKTAIFFGAGASKAEGAPLQGDMFKEYFKFIRASKPAFFTGEMESELRTFFWLIFGLDVDNDDLEKVSFPTFEEAIGVLDLAVSRNEFLKDYDLENIAVNSNRIRQIRVYLVLMMAQIIHEKLRNTGALHLELISKIYESQELNNTIFLTTNYDILIDNAHTKLIFDQNRNSLDYGIDFTNFEFENDWRKPGNNAIKLFKLHGSLNWLYCPTCNNVTLTPLEKGIIRLLTDFSHAHCNYCNTIYTPIIVPPTYFKDIHNVFVQQIWNKAEQELREVEHIIFCGYSFPDADIHIKYLLKRIQTNRRSKIEFTVINNHPNKNEEDKKNEKERFKRFLGRNVLYTDLSFEQFVQHPENIMEPKLRRRLTFRIPR